MEIFEKLTRKYLIWCFNKYISIFDLITDVASSMNRLSAVKMKKQTLDLVHFLLESKLFCIGDVDEREGLFISWNLSQEKA
jgi:hypothetical protein